MLLIAFVCFFVSPFICVQDKLKGYKQIFMKSLPKVHLSPKIHYISGDDPHHNQDAGVFFIKDYLMNEQFPSKPEWGCSDY